MGWGQLSVIGYQSSVFGIGTHPQPLQGGETAGEEDAAGTGMQYYRRD